MQSGSARFPLHPPSSLCALPSAPGLSKSPGAIVRHRCAGQFRNNADTPPGNSHLNHRRWCGRCCPKSGPIPCAREAELGLPTATSASGGMLSARTGAPDHWRWAFPATPDGWDTSLVGSSGQRPRTKRKQQLRTPSESGARSPMVPTYSPLTPEGQIEGVSRFADGLKRIITNWRRRR